MFKPDSLTFGDFEDLEEVTGIPFEKLTTFLDEDNDAAPPLKMIRGLAWIVRRKSEPDLKFDDLRAMPFSALTEFFDGDGDEDGVAVTDPTDAPD